MCKLKPRCFVENKDHYGWLQGIAYTSEGYVLPCCWVDSIGRIDDLKKHNLLDKELKLINNSSVNDIVTSTQWQDFYKMLKENPEEAPIKCKQKCSYE